MAAERLSSEAPRQTFSKKERLCAKTDITHLLEKGRYLSVEGVFRVCFLQRDKRMTPGSGEQDGPGETSRMQGSGARMLISVPKRNFKRAVKRNLLKRRIREAYRRNKPGAAVDLMLVYLPKEVLDYAAIESAIKEVKVRMEEMEP